MLKRMTIMMFLLSLYAHLLPPHPLCNFLQFTVAQQIPCIRETNPGIIWKTKGVQNTLPYHLSHYPVSTRQQPLHRLAAAAASSMMEAITIIHRHHPYPLYEALHYRNHRIRLLDIQILSFSQYKEYSIPERNIRLPSKRAHALRSNSFWNDLIHFTGVYMIRFIIQPNIPTTSVTTNPRYCHHAARTLCPHIFPLCIYMCFILRLQSFVITVPIIPRIHI